MNSQFQKFKFSLFIIIFIYSQAYYIQEGHDSKIISNFTFGSNYYGRFSKEDNIFKTIIEHNSDLWIWLGNAVYLDEPKFDYFENSPKSMNWDYIKKLYEKVKSNEYYKILNEKAPIIGTWGDEEYGIANGDGENKYKEGYKQYYLDFLDVDTIDQKRNIGNLGIYSTYSFGSGYKTVRFILLDLKYNQTSYLNQNDTYDMLGEQQWAWLENIFKKKKETYTFICFSNQILANDRYIMKKWYSGSRKRMFDLIGKYKKNGVIFLSGGLGFAQILKTFCPLPNIGYNLYECTSSGLSHSNKFNSIVNNFYHNDYLIEGTNFNGINFGQVKINWGEKNDINNSYIELEIYDKNDNLVSNVRVNYTELVYTDNTDNFYSDEKNMKNIWYMNVHDGKSCEREIHHRIRTPFMNFRYYLTHFSQWHIALISTIVIILFFEFLFKHNIFFILFLLLLSFIIYCLYYLYDIWNYDNFKYNLQKN